MINYRRTLKWGLVGLGILILLTGAGFLLWAGKASGPEAAALRALESGEGVVVSPGDPLVYQPRKGEPAVGLILYPGGRVDHRSYGPLARRLAAEGYLVAIPDMPLNLAVFDPGAAGEVIQAYPRVEAWAMGGHSLGGAMAARYASTHPGKVVGLVLWASYPPEGADLSGRELEVVSIYGTRDGLASPEEVLSARSLLPEQAEFVAVEGGNHAGFGYYGTQRGDLKALISQQEQADQVVSATLDLLERTAERCGPCGDR